MITSPRTLVAASGVTAVMSACFVFCSGLSARSPKAHGPSQTYKATEAILKARCVSCHNDARHPESVNLSSYEKMLKSGEHGRMVVPGHPEKSKLVLYINGQKQPRMPYGQSPLSAHDINVISMWVRAGAHK